MAKKVLIEGHMGGFGFEDEEPDYDSLYCEECGDADQVIGWVDTDDDDELIDAAAQLGFAYWSISDYADPISLGYMDYKDPEEGITEIANNYCTMRKILGREISMDAAMMSVRGRIDAMRAERGLKPLDLNKSARWIRKRVQEKTDQDCRYLKESYKRLVEAGRVADVGYEEYKALKALCDDWGVDNGHMRDANVSMDDGWEFETQEGDEDLRPAFVCPDAWADEYITARIQQTPGYAEAFESFSKWAGHIMLTVPNEVDGVEIRFRKAVDVKPTIVKNPWE